MATRSLTEAFILMRNNALQNRHLFSEQLNDDLTALVGRDEIDIELGNASYKNSHLPPQWTDRFEEIQFDITRLKKKIKDLATLHNQHLNRPTLDDNADEEQAINAQTQEITNMFHRCQRLVQDFNVSGRLASGKEQMLGQNMASSVARCLQDLSSSFRISQSTYLRKLKNREERSNQYFLEDVDTTEGSESNHLDDLRFSASQQHVVEDNTVFVQQREKEVLQIVRSIQVLNEIFKELSSMIVDQGTILDRIDYNVEQASTHVEKGLEQLQKAEKYQKKSRKMIIISVLFVVVISLLIILIAVKS
jgi:syntaxin 16